MVKVTFKLSDTGTVTIKIDQSVRFDKVLKKAARIAGVKLGGFIAVRNGQIITVDDPVDPDDEIEVFPAISGG